MSAKTHTNNEASEVVKDSVNVTAAEVKNATEKAVDVVEKAEDKANRVVDKAAARATDAVETVEIKVNEAIGSASQSTTWMLDNMRRMLLASIGVVAMTIDEAENLVERMVDRGELAQKDGQKLLKQFRSRLDPRREKLETNVEDQVEKVGTRIEQGMEEMLSRLNIPSKRDIDELSARIAQLSVRIEELKKSK